MSSQRKSGQQPPPAARPRPSFVREARIAWDAPPTQQKKLSDPAAAVRYASTIVPGGDPREHALVIALDIRHHVLGHYVLSIGTMDQALVHPREVFRFAVLAGASSLIFVHTHPSGDPLASPDDHTLTRRLVQVGQIVGIPIVDSIIIAAGGHSWSARMHAPWLIQ